MAASCFIVRSIFAVGLAAGAGVVIGGGLTGCVALALSSSLSLESSPHKPILARALAKT